MPDTAAGTAERVLVLAPRGRDGKLIVSTLTRSGLAAHAVGGMPELCEEIDRGVGVAVLTEEALHGAGLPALREVLARQPAWSDLPLLLLTTGNEADSGATWELVRRLEPAGKVSLLERPLRSMTLVNAVQVALRSRRRQYEVRSLYEGLERRVTERTEELVAKNQELEGFTYAVSHDMRTPLRAIVSNARIALEEEGPQLSPGGARNLERLANAALRMAELVDDLLHYARLGSRDLKRERVDLGELAQEAAEEVARDYADCTLSMRAPLGFVVEGDPRLLGMALRNLIDNACKYRQKGAGAHVELGSCDREGERVYFVRDRGIGFEMAYAPKLFKPFERLHREEYAGTGIGLANVKRAIERHGGRIWAEGEPGKGATFYFTLG